MKACFLRSPLLMWCLLLHTSLSLAGQGVCEDRRVMMIPVSNIPPYYIIDEGHYAGIAIELYGLITERLNWDIDYLECPSGKRCDLLAEEGKLDIYGNLVMGNAYLGYLHYLKPPIEKTPSTIVFYLQKGTAKIESYSDLKGLTVGRALDDENFYEPFISDPSINMFIAVGDIQLFKMLEAGRIDTVIGDEDSTDGYLNNSHLKDRFRKAAYRVDRNAALHITIPKKSPFAKDRLEIEAVLQQLIKSGKVREIYKKYGVDWTPPTQQAPK